MLEIHQLAEHWQRGWIFGYLKPKCTLLAQVLALKDLILMHNSNGIPVFLKSYTKRICNIFTYKKPVGDNTWRRGNVVL